MSIDLGKLGYKVFIDDKQYRDGLRKLLGETQKSSSQIQGIFSKLATTAVLGTVFFKSIGQARAFSKELANLKSIAWDLDMEKVRKEILDLNATLGNSAELTNAMYFAYSAGVRGTEKELAKFTALTAELAQTVGSGITPMMDALTTMMNAYGLKVGDAGNLTDWFYQIVKSGKTTGPELAQSLGQIAATAASAGISLDELGAALATLTTTMPTNIAVTSLAAAIRTMVNPTDDARNSARALGIDLSQTAIQAKGFSGVMQEIFDKTQGRADLIGQLFPAESSRAILSLAGTQVETFTATLADFEGKAGGAKKGFEAILESDDKKWEAMLIVLQKLGTALGDMIFQFMTLGGILNPVYTAINDMGSGTIKLIAQIGAFAGVMVGIQKAANGMKTLKDAFVGFSIKGGYKTEQMAAGDAETSKAMQVEKEGAIRIAMEKRVALAKANAAAEDAVRKQQEILSTRAVAEARIAAEQTARVQSVQTTQAAIVAEKTKELAAARSTAVQIALERQRHLIELKNRASILPHLIARQQQEITLAKQTGTLTQEQTAALAAMQKEYANIGSSIKKASKESATAANAAKLARKAEIDGIAKANTAAQQNITKAQATAQNAIKKAQQAAERSALSAAQGVQRTADAAKSASTAYHGARTTALQASAAQQAHNSAVVAGTAQVGLLKGAWHSLTATMKANPLGFVLMAASLAFSGIMYLINRAEEQAQKNIDRANKLLEEAQGKKQKTDEQVQKDTPRFNRLEELSKKDALSETEMKEAEALIRTLQIEWGNLGVELDKEKKKIIAIKEEAKDMNVPDQTFTIRGEITAPAVPEIPDQTFSIKGNTELPTIPQTPDQSFTIKGNTELPAIPQIPDQTFSIIGNAELPTIPQTPDQSFSIAGQINIPDIPETPDQTFTVRGAAEAPTIPEIQDQVFAIHGKTDLPEIPQTPDQSFSIRGDAELPAIPETPDQSFIVRGNAELPTIPETPDQRFSIKGSVETPIIPEVQDQTFTIIGETEIQEIPKAQDQSFSITGNAELPAIPQTPDQGFTIRGEADLPEVPQVPDQAFTIHGSVDMPEIPFAENQEFSVTGNTEVLNSFQASNQAFTITGEQNIQEIPKAKNQAFTIQGVSVLPEIPETPDQTFSIIGETELPTIPETPDQTFSIIGETDLPEIPEPADQSFSITGEPNIPHVAEVQDQTFTITGKTDIPEVPETPDQEFTVKGTVDMPAIPTAENQEFSIFGKTNVQNPYQASNQSFSITGSSDLPEIPKATDQTFTVKGFADLPEIPETPDQTFTIRGESELPAIPQIPDQSFTIRGESELPTIPETPDQTFAIKGETNLPKIPETPDQFFTITGETNLPEIPHPTDQTFTITGKTKIPHVPETPDQAFTITGETAIPEVPETPDQHFTITGDVDFPLIHKTPDQLFEIRGNLLMPEIPQIPDQTFNVRANVTTAQAAPPAKEEDAASRLAAAKERMKRARLATSRQEQMAVEGRKSVMVDDRIAKLQRNYRAPSNNEVDKKDLADIEKELNKKGLSMRYHNGYQNIDVRSQEFRNVAEKVVKRNLAGNEEYANLSKRSRALAAERKDIIAGRDPEKERQEREKVDAAKRETANLEAKWKNSDLTETDRRELEIKKEFDLYKKNLDTLRETKNISEKDYAAKLASAEAKRDSQIDTNRLAREKEIALLAEQEKAWADGRLSTEEKIAMKKKEIFHQEKELALLQKQAQTAASPEQKRNLALSISQKKAEIARNKGEVKADQEDYRYERAEKDRNLAMEEARALYSADGVMSEEDNIALKKLEYAQQTARVKELETRMNTAATSEQQKQFALQKAQADGKRSLLAEEIRQAEEKKTMEEAERKRKAEVISMEIAHKKDGQITDGEKKELHALKISHQEDRVSELQERERALTGQAGKEDLLAQVQMQRLQAENSLSDLIAAKTTRNEERQNTQGSFNASVLGMMSASPIEQKQLEKMTEVREDLRKLERRSRKNAQTQITTFAP